MLFDDFSIFLAKVIILGFTCLIIYNLYDYVLIEKILRVIIIKNVIVLEHMKKKQNVQVEKRKSM